MGGKEGGVGRSGWVGRRRPCVWCFLSLSLPAPEETGEAAHRSPQPTPTGALRPSLPFPFIPASTRPSACPCPCLAPPPHPPPHPPPTHTHAPTPPPQLTVCPAEVSRADHVDDVQEAVVGLQLRALLAQARHCVVQGAKDEHVVLWWRLGLGRVGGSILVGDSGLEGAHGYVGEVNWMVRSRRSVRAREAAGGQQAAAEGAPVRARCCRHRAAPRNQHPPPHTHQHPPAPSTHLPNLLRNLDVGAVHGADDERAVHRKLHVAGAARLGARGGDVLAAVCGVGAHGEGGREGGEDGGEEQVRERGRGKGRRAGSEGRRHSRRRAGGSDALLLIHTHAHRPASAAMQTPT